MKICLLILAAVFVSLGALAEKDHDGPCAADREKLCPGMKPGKGLFKCMKEKESQVSQACKDARKGRHERRKDAMEDCKADVEKFCKDVKPGRGAIIKCLKQHEAELSADCKAHGKDKKPAQGT